MTTTLLDTNGDPLMIRRGTSPTHTFQVYEQGTTTPKNLTGASEVTFVIAFDRNAASRDLMLTLGNGITHNDAGGLVSVSMTAQQTEALGITGISAVNRWCEIWITDSQGRRDLVGEGPCIIYDSTVTVP